MSGSSQTIECTGGVTVRAVRHGHRVIVVEMGGLMRSTRLHLRHLPLSVSLFDGCTLEPTWETGPHGSFLTGRDACADGAHRFRYAGRGARACRVARLGRTRWCRERVRGHSAVALLTLAGLAISAAFPTLAVGSSPQEPDGAHAPDSAAPSMGVIRAVEPPVMDGIVDESSWALADVATDFLQREPQEGQPATERTEVRVLYDDENLYVGLIAHDSDPSAIIATELRRDEIGGEGRGGGGSDDTSMGRCFNCSTRATSGCRSSASHYRSTSASR